ncbi:MAG: S8 family serine peptidase [Planctomycetota bacterium]
MDRYGQEQVGKLRGLLGDAAGGDSPPVGRRHDPRFRVFGALAMALAMVLMMETAAWAEPTLPMGRSRQVPEVAAKLTPELRAQLEQGAPGEMVACLVMMREPYPFQALSGRPSREKIDVCRATARQSQAPVLDQLRRSPNNARVEREYWVINGFHLLAKPEVIRELSGREDIKYILHIGEVHLVDPVLSEGKPETRAVEWGVQKVNAPACWNEGFTGEGVIVAHTDTGVDTSHPALEGKFTGYWHDSINGRPDPYDDHGHGTHTMGTILGGDGNGPFTEDIGVAPGATFVTAKILNSAGQGTDTQVLDGMQYIADLETTVDMRVMSASWADSNPTGLWVWDMCQTFKSIGILPVFAIGNDPNADPYPPPGTAAVPGNYPLVLGVGATDSSDNMAYFSLRGPAPNQSPWTDPANWYRPDWNRIKPDISAPGVSVRSSLPGGQYASWNGTSMATPHVAGTVAILCQKNPTMDLATMYNIILDSADQPSQGAPYPNNAYGWGRLNAYAALQDTPGMNQPWISVTQMLITDDAPGGNGNGLIEPGETAELVITVKNIGQQPAFDATVELSSQDNYVTVGAGVVMFGELSPGESASNASLPLTFTAHVLSPPGHLAHLLLTLSAQGGAYPDYSGTKPFSVQIGTPPPPLVLFVDDFEYGPGESFADFWTVTGNWTWTSGQSHSPTHSAYSGGTALDNFTYVTQRNAVDLSNFREASLTWWHKYDFSDGDVFIDAEAAISMNGGAWQNIWEFDFVTHPDSVSWTENAYSLMPTPG